MFKKLNKELNFIIAIILKYKKVKVDNTTNLFKFNSLSHWYGFRDMTEFNIYDLQKIT